MQAVWLSRQLSAGVSKALKHVADELWLPATRAVKQL